MNKQQRQHGYTAIELIMVFVILSILAAAAAPAVLGAFGRASFNDGISKVRDVCEQARSLALRMPGTTNGEHYGVRLKVDNGQVVASVMLGDQALGDLEQKLQPAVQVFLAGSPMGNGEVAWYYQSGTGLPLQRTGSASYLGPGAQVGCPAPDLASVPGLNGGPVPVHQIAPDSGGNAGVEIATRDGEFRRALRIFSSGTLVLEPLEALE